MNNLYALRLSANIGNLSGIIVSPVIHCILIAHAHSNFHSRNIYTGCFTCLILSYSTIFIPSTMPCSKVPLRTRCKSLLTHQSLARLISAIIANIITNGLGYFSLNTVADFRLLVYYYN